MPVTCPRKSGSFPGTADLAAIWQLEIPVRMPGLGSGQEPVRGRLILLEPPRLLTLPEPVPGLLMQPMLPGLVP